MKIVRSMVTNNKALVALVLLLCFLTTGFAKGLSSVKPSSNFQLKKQTGKQLVVTAAEDDASQTFFDKFDGDADDADLFFHEPVFAQKFSFGSTATQTVNTIHSLYSEDYKVALYDLYCNWKFHLI